MGSAPVPKRWMLGPREAGEPSGAGVSKPLTTPGGSLDHFPPLQSGVSGDHQHGSSGRLRVPEIGSASGSDMVFHMLFPQEGDRRLKRHVERRKLRDAMPIPNYVRPAFPSVGKAPAGGARGSASRRATRYVQVVGREGKYDRSHPEGGEIHVINIRLACPPPCPSSPHSRRNFTYHRSRLQGHRTGGLMCKGQGEETTL